MEKRCISGVYPEFRAYSQYRPDGAHTQSRFDECGIGAVVFWADKLWYITYAPHKPGDSDHKLYSTDKNMNLLVHPESAGHFTESDARTFDRCDYAAFPRWKKNEGIQNGL